MPANGDDAEARREKRRFKVPAKLEAVLGRVLDGVEPPPAPAGPALPDRFVLIDEIGRGAQSHVYAVFDKVLNCKSALKIFNDGGGGRGYREAQALSGVEHENVVRVQDVGLHDERVYLRMEFVDGSTLRRWVAERPWRERLPAYIQAGRGLAAAHAAGIVHRDFKPDNALVREADNRVVVVDFGLARGRIESPEVPTSEPTPSASTTQAFVDPISRSGQMQGTPAYMAPEQFLRETLDERTDQFSFCVALYEALDGERPFRGQTIPELARAVTKGEIRGPPRDAPPWVWRVIRRGLNVDPAQRYPSMHELLDDLENDPRKWLLRIGATAAGLAIVASAWLLWQGEKERHAAEQAESQAATAAERARKEALEQEIDDREDALTLRESRSVIDDDPTVALALLKNVSPGSEFWKGGIRMLAADAAYRGVAREVMEIGEGQAPHGLSPHGAVAVTREPNSHEVTLYFVEDEQERLLGVATGLPVVAFSPDGRSIAAQRLPQGVNMWTGPADKPAVFLGPSPDAHHRMIVAHGDAGVITFGRHPDVVRWRNGDSQVLGGHTDSVEAVAVDHSGAYAATFDGARRMRLWNLETAEPRSVPGVSPIAFSPTGSLAVADRGLCGDDDDRPTTLVRITDPATDAVTMLCTDDVVSLASLAFSPSGSRLAGALASGRVLAWELDTGSATELERSDGEVGELRFATDDVLGSRSPDTTLVLWTLPSTRPQVMQGHVGVAYWARRDDGKIVTFGQEGSIRVWEVPPRRDRSLPAHEGTVTHVAYAGSELVTAGRDGSVRAWPLGGQARLISSGAAAVVVLSVAPGGQRVAFSRASGDVVVAELTGTGEAVLATREQIFGLGWDRSGKRLAVSALSGGVEILDPSSGAEVIKIAEPDGYRVKAAHFQADGAWITTAGWVEGTTDGDGAGRLEGTVSIRAFDANTGARTRRVEVDAPGLDAVAFSADDRFVAITTFERAVLVWDAEAGVREFGSHRRRVYGADFSPDSRTLVTAGEDGVAKLWDLESMTSRTLDFTRPLRDVAFSPDGTTFTAVGDARIAFVGRDDLPRDPDRLREWVSAATDLMVDPTELDLATR